jgi:disulfide bond formation protein DsbB
LFRKTWGRGIVDWTYRHSLVLGLLLAIAAIVGSLFYSSVMGFAPCDLCWWQRVLIYPQAILFGVALKSKDYGVFKYSSKLAILSILVSIYNIYIQGGGDPLVPCSTTASCTKVYVEAFGYITIPAMALTIGIAFLLLAWINKKHD